MDRPGSSGFALLTLVLAACEPPAPPVPATVEIDPVSITVVTTGVSVQFTARVYDDRGELIPDAEIEWRSRHPHIARISRSGLATVVGQGSTHVQARHESLAANAMLNADLEVRGLRKLGGDDQSAPALTVLPERLTVRVYDLNGTQISGVAVEFEPSSGGVADPPKATTNSYGEASTSWILGLPTGIQTLQAAAGEFEVEFRATATNPPLAIPAKDLLRGRLTVPYHEVIEARGGYEPLFWSLESGSLPAGLALDTTGLIAGTPTDTGWATFTVRVRDSEGTEASRRMELRVCEAPLRMTPGEITVDNPVGASRCPHFLPAGENGDRYRVAVVRTDVVEDPTRISVAVKVNRAGGGTSQGHWFDPTPAPRPAPRLPPALSAGLRVADESSRLHARLLADAERLVRELGTGAVLPDTRSDVNRGGAGVAMQKDPPSEWRAFRPYLFYRESCEDPPPTPRAANLVAYNDELAIYQDSVQQGLDPIRVADARQVLDYYEEYGAETIEEYFGGVPDINGDRRVNVFVSPVVPEWAAAFVWSGDFLSREACSWSNEMELVYFHENMFDMLEHAPDSGHYQALPTMVHEIKHVSSLYIRARLGAFHPFWVEEGTAEIAAEVSSRMAMEAAGGVARGGRLNRDAYPPRNGIIITPENYGVLLRLARMTRSYSEVLNSITVDPTVGHTYYGTSWHFHRFLGDAYGNAAGRGDGALFTALNDGTAPPGDNGIMVVVGESMGEIVARYAGAMMLNGTGAPEPDYGFTTYDFPSATSELFRPGDQPEGLYPWAHTGIEPVGFHDAIYSGTLAPGGIRFHEFESDGTGSGIELEISTTDVIGSVRIVVARVR